MSRRIAFRGGRILDPATGTDTVADLLVADGRIAAIGTFDGPVDETIEIPGQLLIPGLVDLAARLREPGAAHKATIASELRAAASAGITAVCLPPDTHPVVDTPSVVEWIQDRAQRAAYSRVHVLGAATEGLQGELLTALGPMKRAGCIGVMHDGVAPMSARLARCVLEYAANFDLPLHVRCREPSLDNGTCAHEGPVATQLGLPASPVSAETAAMALWIELVADTGIGVHFARLSSARACQLLRRAKQDGLPVTGDVAAHQLFLNDNALSGYEAFAHVNPPLRSEDDRRALVAAVADGTIDAICSDHQPHEIDAKTNPLPLTQPGMSALETLLPLAWQLVIDEHIAPLELIRRISTAPAAITRREGGSLALGAVADLCAVDIDSRWTFQRETMVSAGRNTAFDGWHFQARASCTMVGGELRFRRG